ncbi:toprim domain-containing protein [Kribbella ginsengisoli]|uniref:Toprim domain-containing protein n=1 Tax=Kribbella ginsengisoli TaxID=363865 RepID=A0ABP6VQA7_9ACTN
MNALVRANELAAELFRRELRNRRSGWAADHLIRRRLGAALNSDSTWEIGFAPDRWTRLVDHLRSNGVDDDVIVAAGLASPTPSGYLAARFRDRITFVAHDIDLRPVGFVARSRSGEPRYLNTRSTKVYTKGRSLVGLVAQRKRLASGAVPVVVEGPMDAYAVSLLGDQWAGLTPCGTALTRHQALMIREHAVADSVIMMFDADAGGRAGAERSLALLAPLFGTVLIAELPERRDPAALYSADPGLLRTAIRQTRPLLEFAIDAELARWVRVLDHVSGQVDALRAVAPLVVRLPSDRIGTQVVRLAAHLNLEERVVSRELLACVGRRPRAGASADDLEADLDLGSRTFQNRDPGS